MVKIMAKEMFDEAMVSDSENASTYIQIVNRR